MSGHRLPLNLLSVAEDSSGGRQRPFRAFTLPLVFTALGGQDVSFTDSLLHWRLRLCLRVFVCARHPQGPGPGVGGHSAAAWDSPGLDPGSWNLALSHSTYLTRPSRPASAYGQDPAEAPARR